MHTEALEVNHFRQEYRTAVLRQDVAQARADGKRLTGIASSQIHISIHVICCL
jgi:hypothetical protein